jgi:hypothetical protein
MSLNQPVASVKRSPSVRSPALAPKFIMFHGVNDPEMRIPFEEDEGGRGWDYILDIMSDDYIPVRRNDCLVMVLVPCSAQRWWGIA